jgi:hypothetical protein
LRVAQRVTIEPRLITVGGAHGRRCREAPSLAWANAIRHILCLSEVAGHCLIIIGQNRQLCLVMKSRLAQHIHGGHLEPAITLAVRARPSSTAAQSSAAKLNEPKKKLKQKQKKTARIRNFS